jgi:hypothetical protein
VGGGRRDACKILVGNVGETPVRSVKYICRDNIKTDLTRYRLVSALD